MKHVVSLLALTVAVTGCLNERVYVDPNQNVEFGAGSGSAPSNLAVQNGRLRGDFGPRRGFDGETTELSGSSDREWNQSTVNVTRTEQTRGTGMVILWTQGVLLEDLEPGAHDFLYDENSLDLPPVSANVCSGADSASIDYDLPAEQVSVVVTQTPEGRQFDVHTETPVVDMETGERSGAVETSDSTFVLNSGR